MSIALHGTCATLCKHALSRNSAERRLFLLLESAGGQTTPAAPPSHLTPPPPFSGPLLSNNPICHPTMDARDAGMALWAYFFWRLGQMLHLIYVASAVAIS